MGRIRMRMGWYFRSCDFVACLCCDVDVINERLRNPSLPPRKIKQNVSLSSTQSQTEKKRKSQLLKHQPILIRIRPINQSPQTKVLQPRQPSLKGKSRHLIRHLPLLIITSRFTHLRNCLGKSPIMQHIQHAARGWSTFV